MENIYTKEEIQEIIKEKFIVVMDTNVWLDLYYLPFDKIKSIVEGIEKSDFFYMPHQVFKEILNNNGRIRKNIENEYRDSFKNTINNLRESKTALKDASAKYKEKNVNGINELCTDIEENLNLVIDKIEKSIEEFKKKNRTSNNCVTSNNDIIEKLVKKLLGENEFTDFETLELLKIYEEGELRYKYGIPPGITDGEKDKKTEGSFVRKYGDLILWKEILKYIKTNETNIVLVQNETKEDWWDSKNTKGKKISDALIEEFHKYSKKRNAKFLMMRFEEFFSHFSDRFIENLENSNQIDTLLKKKEEAFKYFNTNLETIIWETYLSEITDLLTYSEDIEDTYLYMPTAEGEIDEIGNVYLQSVEVLEMTSDSVNNTNNKKYRVLLESEINVSASTTVRDLYYSGSIKSNISYYISFVVEDNTNLEKEIKDCLDIVNFELEEIIEIETKYLNLSFNGRREDYSDDDIDDFSVDNEND